MNPGNDIHLRGKRTDLRDLPAVGTFVILQDHLAHGLLLILVHSLIQQGQPFFVLRKSLLQLFGDGPDISLPGLLVIGKHGLLHLLGRHQFTDPRRHILRDGAALILVLGFAHFRHNPVDESDDGLVDLVSLIDGLDHLLLRNLIGAGLNHDDFLPGGSHCQSQIPVFPLLLGRVYHELPIHKPHLGHGTGTVKRNVRNAGSHRRPQHCHQFRTAGRVHAHNHIVQRDIIAVILGKKRTHGPVNDAACEHCVLTGLALPFVKATGNLAHRVHLLFVFHAQREKVDPFPGLVRRGGGAQNHRISIAHKSAAVGLLSHPVDINLQGAPRQFHFIALVHKFPPIPLPWAAVFCTLRRSGNWRYRNY